MRACHLTGRNIVVNTYMCVVICVKEGGPGRAVEIDGVLGTTEMGDLWVYLAHHHGAELVKVHSPGSILIDFFNDSVQVFRR